MKRRFCGAKKSDNPVSAPHIFPLLSKTKQDTQMPRPLCAACDGCWKGVVEKMRKKYGWLFGLTLAAIAGILMGGRLMKKQPVEVSVITLEPQLVEQTVSCSGKVEAAKSQNVYLRCV